MADLGPILDEIEEVVAEFTGAPRALVQSSISSPPGNSGAVYGTAVALQVRPEGGSEQLAKEMSEYFNRRTGGQFTIARPTGSYVNFVATVGAVEALSRPSTREQRAKGSILIEAHPPNIDSEFCVVHYRALATSNYLYNLFSSQGFETRQLLFWNDCGLPAGRAILLERQRSMSGDDSAVLPSVDGSEASVVAASIEAGDEAIVNEWNFVRRKVLGLYMSQMRSFNFSFDQLVSESEHFQRASDLRSALIDAGLATVRSDGSIVSNTSRSGDEEVILFRRDGTSLYLTRDLAELLRRAEMPVDRNVYVVARSQPKHFRKLFELAEGLGTPLAEVSEYASFGLSHPRGVTVPEAFDAISKTLSSWPSESSDSPEISAGFALRLYVLLTKRTSELIISGEAALIRALGQYLELWRACQPLASSQSGASRRPAEPVAKSRNHNDARLVRQVDGMDRAKVTAGVRLDPSMYLRYTLDLVRSLQAASRAGSPLANGLEDTAIGIIREALSYMEAGHRA